MVPCTMGSLKRRLLCSLSILSVNPPSLRIVTCHEEAETSLYTERVRLLSNFVSNTDINLRNLWFLNTTESKNFDIGELPWSIENVWLNTTASHSELHAFIFFSLMHAICSSVRQNSPNHHNPVEQKRRKLHSHEILHSHGGVMEDPCPI